MNLVEALAEADRLAAESDFARNKNDIDRLLRAACGSLMDSHELREKCADIALVAARQGLGLGAFADCKRFILLGRQLSQSVSKIIELELCALDVFFRSGDRELALDKLKRLNRRQGEMTAGQLSELSRLRLIVLKGIRDDG